jgi:hypothetical protein
MNHKTKDLELINGTNVAIDASKITVYEHGVGSGNHFNQLKELT